MINRYRKRRMAQTELTCCRNVMLRFAILPVLYGLLAQSAVALSDPGKGGRNGSVSGTTALPSRKEVSRAIALSGAYLERACGPDGKFTYSIDPRSGRENRSYNIVRHAGAIYALATLNRSQPNRKVVDAMVRAANFMRQNYIGPGVRAGQLVVWSEPSGRNSEAELGATGLGVVALAEVRKVEPKTIPVEQLQSLGRFMLFLQKEDGSFVHKYRAAIGPVPNKNVLYYPGEAALGFIALYETDHSREWLVAASKALAYLVRSRAESTKVPHDHWALIATARLLPHCEKDSCPVSRKELLEHATKICNSIVQRQLRNPASPLDGAFDPAGRTAPVAARLEGLLAALEFLPNDELRVEVEAAANRSIAFLLRAQINSGPFVGGMPAALAGRPNASEIRIDYVQHALCAWLRYLYVLDRQNANRHARSIQ